jgi:subtilisin family serine protease
VLTAGGATAQPQPGTYETVVVQLKGAAVNASSVLSGLPGTSPKAAPHDRYVMRVPVSEVSSVLARLQRDRNVSYASVARPVHATASPNDPCYATACPPPVGGYDNNGNFITEAGPVNQAYLNTIGAPAAWDITKGNGVVVAVLDSGVAANPDLAGKIHSAVNVCAGDDPACGSPGQAGDPFGHGTHVSGIVAADTGNNTGVASLGWNLQVDMFKVLDSSGQGNTVDVATAIYDAVDAGDRVINMSLANYSCAYANQIGHPELCGPDPDEERAVEYALAHNAVVVAAAGNDGYDSPTYPASYPGVLSVAATDNNGTVLCFSQWGSSANIAAPGMGIVSTWNGTGNVPGGYTYFVLDGTSMASPQVAAAAGLMVAHAPNLTGPQITQLLEQTAGPTGGNGGCGPNSGSQPPATHSIYGGLLNVPAALQAESNPPTRFNGYDMAGSNGAVYPFGTSIFEGDKAGSPLNQPVVGMARSNDGLGYWLVARDGGIFNFGNAGYFGSTGNRVLNKPIVGMAEDPATGGYWLVASDGGIFNFNAPYLGSMGGSHINQPVVGMASTPDGGGYWLVAADGGIFTFGDAGFRGSTGNIRLNKPVVGMSPTSSGQGYWLVATDGGIFNFGDAGFYGSTGNIVLNRPVVAMATTPGGHGYWLFATDGGLFNLGDARFYGSLGAVALPAPVVSASD